MSICNLISFAKKKKKFLCTLFLKFWIKLRTVLRLEFGVCGCFRSFIPRSSEIKNFISFRVSETLNRLEFKKPQTPNPKPQTGYICSLDYTKHHTTDSCADWYSWYCGRICETKKERGKLSRPVSISQWKNAIVHSLSFQRNFQMFWLRQKW